MKAIYPLGLTIAVGLLGTAPAAAQRQADSTAFAQAMGLYSRNQLAEALPRFEAVARGNPGNVEPLIWYAETARRLGKMEESLKAAREALVLAPCSSFAHNVVAGVYNVAYSGYERANADSTWFHLNRAIQCNPDDGNAWLWLWTETLHRKSEDLERRTLHRLLETSFFSPSYIAFNRWVLGSLPRDAILLTAGDLDTYPAVALQEAALLRRDVAVVNLPLLNLPWYVRHVVERYGLPMPIPADSLDGFQPHEDSAGTLITLSSTVFGRWRDLVAQGSLTRPLTVALTTGSFVAPATLGRYRIEGPFVRIIGEGEVTQMDTAMVSAILDQLTGSSFSGPTVSPQDRSPVRRSNTANPGSIVVYLASLQGQALAGAGAIDAARQRLSWAERFGSDARIDSAVIAPLLQPLRDSLP